MVVAALAVEAAAAFVAGQFFSLWAAALLAGAAGLAWGTAKFGFDGLLQGVVHPDRRGSAFTRSETLFQLAWVLGAVLPVAVHIPAGVGLAVAGGVALAAQTVFVSGLLVEPRLR
ncbi:MAG TPA: MFS transporter, partial [Acidimicrobiia bacterium]|nr:MFS transporter [Acidimicrobiia bacterium]